MTAPILVDKECTIGKGVCLKGPVVMGAGCSIRDGATIENSILWQKVSVGEQAVLRDCIVASNNHVEDNVRVEGATINDNSLAKRQP